MQLVIELDRTDNGSVRGAVVRDGETEPFSGWLQLLELLEAALPDD